MVAFERTMEVLGNKSEAPYATLLALRAAGFSPQSAVQLKEGQVTELNMDGVRINNDITIARIVAQSAEKNNLIGTNCFENAKIDEVMCLCEGIVDGFLSAEDVLSNIALSKDGTVLGDRITVADIAVWTVIAKCEKLQKKYSSLFNKVLADPVFAEAHIMVGKFAVAKPKTKVVAKEKQKDEGKFVDLPGAEKGKVVVRFPPEASGYLHIGHAKAALLNQYYQQAFDGQLIMRFDDTNPAKENAHFEEVIKEDLKLLNIIPDRWTHSSDHFELLLQMCEKLIKEGKAFIDDTDTETMRKEREDRQDSRHRNNTPEQNMKMWEEMKKGTEYGLKCCARIKMDMKSNNGAMRDPTIYRCKPEEHVRTGMKYKVYPTYDFTCPIVDSVEGVTHALRTTEYHDRDDQYYFICDALGLRKPYIWEYARLNMTNTVMSKRKLTWFVEERHVDGWDDPRLPTVRGVMRRGLTVEGLKQFIVAQGGSRSIVMMEWDKIWAFNKKVIDPVAPRYTALQDASLVPVVIQPAIKDEEATVPLHPKNPEVGTKSIWRGAKLLLEQADAREMKADDTVTFVNWGNLKIVRVEKRGETVIRIEARLDLENRDYKKTLKVTWLGDVGSAGTSIPVQCADYDHIISKAVVGKDEDWKQYINYDSVHFTKMVGEPALRSVKKGDIIQLQRKGFYVCDQPYQAKSPFSGQETPLLLIYIPDGHVKESATKQTEPSSTKTPAPTVGGDRWALYQQIEKQGQLVRDLKGKDAKSDATKKAIATLLEMKKQYKDKCGEEWKPGQSAPSAPAAVQEGGDKAAKYKEVEDQGLLVRDLKGKDAKSDATKAAIAKLLDLKKQYKEKFGEEWKPGQAPAASAPAPSSAPASGAAALYKQVEDQGLLVRELKGKDPKSDATKAAIAKLLELKKQYKEQVGAEWKPGQAPAAAPVAATPSGGDLYKQVEDQGQLVRELKGKDPKSDVTKAAIAKLLELKKQYKETVGQEWKPGQSPAAPVLPAATQSVNAPGGGDGLYKEIEAQGLLVRELKGKDPKSDETKAAIAKLLELKKKYKESTGSEYKPGAAPVAAANPAVSTGADGVAAEIAKQGDLVRSLKAKDPKSPAAADAIAQLLKLKLQYKELTGKDYQPAGAPAAKNKKVK